MHLSNCWVCVAVSSKEAKARQQVLLRMGAESAGNVQFHVGKKRIHRANLHMLLDTGQLTVQKLECEGVEIMIKEKIFKSQLILLIYMILKRKQL